MYQNNWLMLFTDYFVETQMLRRSFKSIKVALQVKLWEHCETIRFFTSLKDAAVWLKTLRPMG